MHVFKVKLQKKEALLFILGVRGGVNVMFRWELYITLRMVLACQQDRAAWLTFKIVHQN